MLSSLMGLDSSNPSDWSLSETDARVLNFLGDEELTHFTFEGLKRRLNVHSETLARSLGRLEESGIVTKDTEGYTVKSVLKDRPDFDSTVHPDFREPVLQMMMPPYVTSQRLLTDLEGKWFGILRWLGYAERAAGMTLKWVTTDGTVQVDASLSHNVLRIVARQLRDEGTDLALRAVYQLVGYVTRLYSRAGMIQPVGVSGWLDSQATFA